MLKIKKTNEMVAVKDTTAAEVINYVWYNDET